MRRNEESSLARHSKGETFGFSRDKTTCVKPKNNVVINESYESIRWRPLTATALTQTVIRLADGELHCDTLSRTNCDYNKTYLST